MAVVISQDEVRRAALYAKAYWARGFNVFPSRRDRKGPNLDSYDATKPLDPEVYHKRATGNLQLSTGCKWGIIVIDLDGPLAMDKWAEWCQGKPNPPTWTVQSDPARGTHLYYRPPAGVEKIEGRRLWGLWEMPANKWAKRAAVELFGDGNLITAPPSIHPETARQYQFIEGHSPRDLELPEIPTWMLLLPKVDPPGRSMVPSGQNIRTPPKPPGSPPGGRLNTDEVLALIPDKIALAGSWGLRIASGKVNGSGFLKCYRAGTDEKNASAGISEETGRYWEDGEICSLFDLGAKLGAFADWKACKNWCEGQFKRG